MTETYRIVLNSSMGPREGALQLTITDTSVDGTLTLLGHVNPVCGIKVGEESYALECSMYTGVEPVPCSFTMEIHDGRLHGWAETKRGRMTCSGALLEPFNSTEGQSKYE